jgi:hypothetical protein
VRPTHRCRACTESASEEEADIKDRDRLNRFGSVRHGRRMGKKQCQFPGK